MQFLKATLPGQYLDGFLYRGHLYLLRDDSSLMLVNWDELISKRCPGPGNRVDPLAELLFIDNSLARIDSRILHWSGYPVVQNLFRTLMADYADIDLSLDNELSPYDLGSGAIHSMELYYSHLWLAGEEGVSVCQLGPGYGRKGQRSRINRVISEHTYSITPEKGFIWVAQRDATIGLPLTGVASNRVGISFGNAWELPFSALSVGWHWSDPTFSSRDNLSSRAFMRANWLESDRENDSNEQRQTACLSPGDVIESGNKSYLEIDLGDLTQSRLFCSRDRVVTQSSTGLSAIDWSYGFSRSDLSVPEKRSEHGLPERVLISTFGWVVEGSTGVAVYTRQGCSSLAQGEVVQVRTFPSSIRYENMILVVFDDRIEIYSVLDYDFLLTPDMRVPSIGRRSEFYAQRRDDPTQSSTAQQWH